MNLRLSPLGHSWFLDLDGTILKHNGYKLDGKDSFLPGAKEFLGQIPQGDKVVFVTSRTTAEQEATEAFLQENGVEFHQIIYDMPFGERILLNDDKPSGLKTALAVSFPRDQLPEIKIEVDPDL